MASMLGNRLSVLSATLIRYEGILTDVDAENKTISEEQPAARLRRRRRRRRHTAVLRSPSPRRSSAPHAPPRPAPLPPFSRRAPSLSPRRQR